MTTKNEPLLNDVDPVTGGASRPDGAGMYLYWEGRKSYRTRMPAPRVLQPVQKLHRAGEGDNLIIEGDNLQAMVSLRSQYKGAVDVAYLDPPYNTGRKDFRYSDQRFRDPNAAPDDAVYVRNEDGGRHTKWLNFMGPRVYLTWELLSDTGVCFVSIDDTELFRLGMLMDEIFGERNRLGVIVWRGATDNNGTRIATGHEYILCYAKRIENVPAVWEGTSAAKSWMLAQFDALKETHTNPKTLEAAWQALLKHHVKAREEAVSTGTEGTLIDLGPTLPKYKHVEERGPYASNRDVHGSEKGQYFYPVKHPNGRTCKPPESGYRFPEETMKQLVAEDRILFGEDEKRQVQIKKFLRDVKLPLRSVIELSASRGAASLKTMFPDSAERFQYAKPVELIEMLLDFAGDQDALVLDPFAGSGTTAHAVLRLNKRDGSRRRFILIEEGSKDDPYCRTLTAPRVRAAIDKEELGGGFKFMTTGRRLNKSAILELERDAIANLIIQTDVTGTVRGITKVNGTHVIGHNAKSEAICLHWNGRTDSTIDADVLALMFKEAKALHLNRPIRVYGTTCLVGETQSFRFCQIPDEILAALQLDEEENEDPTLSTLGADFVETLERAAQSVGGVDGR